MPTNQAEKTVREHVRQVLLEKIREKAEPLADKLISTAMDGNVIALKEVFERSIGKEKEEHTVTVNPVGELLAQIRAKSRNVVEDAGSGPSSELI